MGKFCFLIQKVKFFVKVVKVKFYQKKPKFWFFSFTNWISDFLCILYLFYISVKLNLFYFFYIAISHNGVLAGRNFSKITVGLQRDKKNSSLKPDHISEADFYNELNDSYLLNEEELFDNGYPRWVDPTTKQRAWIKPPDNGKAVFVENSSKTFL